MFFRRIARPPLLSDPARCLVRAPHVISTTQGGDTVLLDPKRERYFTLNAVSSRVWELLAAGTTFTAIVQTIRDEYELPIDTPSNQIEGDVAKLLDDLNAAGLLAASALARSGS